MPRAVLDSSVLVSAFITPQGATAEVLRAEARNAYTLCLSPEIIAETITRLRAKDERFKERYGYSEYELERFAATLWAIADIVTDLPDLTGAVPDDPKDDVIIATAVAARADYLVAGDRKHLLALGEYQGIRIMSVREFLGTPE